jgi:type VI secretion system secreted protein VgrG
MAQKTQIGRDIRIETPLGKDVLLLRSFSAHEEISRLFEIDLDLLSENPAIDADAIIGQNVTIRMNLDDKGTRYWNGYISRFVQGVDTSTRFTTYQATMVPWLWFLTLTSDCRIFQEKTVLQIIDEIFSELGIGAVEDRTSGGYRTWTYCVQYRETDFNFVSRLMEKEGIYYYFKHEPGKCTLVLCDSRSKHDFFENHNKIPFTPEVYSSALQEYISQWRVDKKIRSGKFVHSDYNPLTPNTDLITVEEDKKGHAQAGYEIFDFPGEYAVKSEGDKYAKVHLEEMAACHMVCSGESDSRGICSGYLFTLDRHPQKNLNQDYLIWSTTCYAAAEGYETSGGQDEVWSCSFTAIPSTVQFRPERTTPKPVITGSQTAVVTGPSGEEIYTDEHGRIKVHFHWDRKGPFDENSSCWIRVSQNWAGKNWGAFFLPRIGHEVIVSFLEGDPDQPIVTGSVYHAINTPPYSLPGDKTRGTIKSDSTKGGGGSNEMRFEDKKGSEEIYLHGQKDWTIAIENDKNQTVGHDETMSVGNNRTKDVGVDQKETIGSNKSITVGSNHDETIGADKTLSVGSNHTETIGSNMTETIGANMTHTVGSNKTETISIAKALTIGAAYQVSVGAAMNETVGAAKMEEIGAIKSVNVGANSSENVASNKSVDAGGNISETAGKDVKVKSGKKMALDSGDDFSIDGKKKGVIEIADELSIKVGSASITMKKNGDITIKGKKINIKGSGDIVIKGSKILEN